MSYIPPVSSFLSISVGGTLLFSVSVLMRLSTLLLRLWGSWKKAKKGRKEERKEDFSPLLYFYTESIEQKQSKAKPFRRSNLCLAIFT